MRPPMGHEPYRYFPCTHCGAHSPYPVRLIEQYSGRITRQCETCGELFHIRIPLKDRGPGAEATAAT